MADDLHLGTFSDTPPWSLEKNPPEWRGVTDSLRAEQARQLPIITKPPKLPPVGRGATVIRILGFSIAKWALFERRKPDSRALLSRRVRVAAEKLGPTYIKLAQIISAGEGVFPAELVAECRLCRDQVPPVSYAEVVDTIESDLGMPLHELFTYLNPTPVAAASIAQVHRARLKSGEDVVVKVQRPGIKELVEKDLKVLAWLAPLLVGRIPVTALANPPALVDLFAETIIEELDFRLEGDNMLDVAKVMVDLDQRGFVVPRPHPTHVTRRVLVMEPIDGFVFDDVEAITAAGIDTHAVIRTGMIGFLEGAFLHGVFHGDLHGGNLFVLPDGRTGLIDFGITGRLTETEQMGFLKMMMSAFTNDVRGQVAALRDLGALPFDADIDAVVKDLGLDGAPVDPTKLSPDELVSEIQQVLKALLGYGARMPKALMLYVKNLIFIDGAIANIAPELDLFAVVTEIATHFAINHGATIATQLGVANQPWDIDLDGVKASFGVDPNEHHGLTYAELQERRALIHKRMAGKRIL